MAAAVSTRSAMQFHLLVLGIAICLSCFATPVIAGGFVYDHDWYETCQTYPVDPSVAVNTHNLFRSKVNPSSSNMRRMYWNESLAAIAQERACQCNYDHYSNYRHPLSSSQALAVENQGLSTDHHVTDIIKSWFNEGESYQYHAKACYPDQYYSYTCQHYIRMIWSKACEVGCAIAECSGLYEPYNRFYGHYYNHNDYYEGPMYLLVCIYGAGYPEDDENMFYVHHPYRAGPPCRDCPRQYPLCNPNPFVGPDDHYVQGTQDAPTSIYGGLCYNRQEMCVGSDPHFAIRLPEGGLLCYTFQGVHGAIFNLVSNDQLQMNALFVPDDTAYNNTWLGSIGISILDNGNKVTTLQFTAADGLVRIGERAQLDARTVKKLSFNKGKLTVLEVPSNYTQRYPRVHVELIDSELEFTVRFAKNNHLDLHWHSVGLLFEDSKGIVGQFFCGGVRIDADAQLLRVPGRLPVPVEQQDLWKFMEQSLHDDTKCWTSAYRSSQGAGIVAGTYKDYIVDDLLAVGN